MMHIESSGPSYQIKLNTGIDTVTEQIRYKSLDRQTVYCSLSTLYQLECNKQVLFWDGGPLEQRR